MRKHLRLLSNIWTAKGNNRNRVSALVRAVKWYIHSQSESEPVCHKIYGDRRIWCHPGGFIARSIMLFGDWYEYDTLNFIHSFLRPEDQFLDVGANIGVFSILASKTVPANSIFCIEPGKTQRLRLEENFKLNGITDAHIFPYAVGETGSFVNFSLDDAVSHVVHSESGATSTEVVEIQRMDSFLPMQRFGLSKIDVEGFELPALRGSGRLIEAGLLPVILLELNGSSIRFGIQTGEVLDHLRSSGYRVGLYNHDENTISCSGHLWDDVIAFNPDGEKLIRDRMEGIRIS